MFARLAPLVLVACMAASAAFPSMAAYPDRPIRILVPFSPGGSVDILARLVAEQITKPLGQSVIVENRPGGSGAVASAAVARAEPDGYTLLMASTTTLAINPNLRQLPYSLADFAPVSLVASVPHVLVVRPTLPVDNLKDFIAYAAEPSRKINFASSGPGSPHHLAGVMLNQLAGLSMTEIPYKGSGPALVDLMGGQVDVMSVDLPPAVPYITSGKIRPLAVAAKVRSPYAPEVPTFAEAGLPGFEVTGWYGIVAPAAVPSSTVELLGKVISEALAKPEVREKLGQLGATAEGATQHAFGEHLQRENAKWSKVIKDAGLRLQ